MSARHPLFAAGLTESLRLLSRGHLASRPEALARVRALSGRVLALRLEPVGATLYLCPAEDEVQVLTELGGATPDVTLAGNLAAYGRALRGDSASAWRDAGLSLQGDAERAREFHALFRALALDGAGASPLVAGLPRLARAGEHWVRSAAQSLETDLAEYLREETRWLPEACEIEDQLTAVDRLRDDVERLAVRVERLAARRAALPAVTSDPA